MTPDNVTLFFTFVNLTALVVFTTAAIRQRIKDKKLAALEVPVVTLLAPFNQYTAVGVYQGTGYMYDSYHLRWLSLKTNKWADLRTGRKLSAARPVAGSSDYQEFPVIETTERL